MTTADKVKSDAENARMAKLYREQVLGEKPVEGLVSLDSIAPAKPVTQQMVEPVAGD
jgi:7,8-dihydro-6-hydroxymethylpterin dimethyltransferase